MTWDLVKRPEIHDSKGQGGLSPAVGGFIVPAFIADHGEDAARRFVEFFTANIPNDNTRAAYARAVMRFIRWSEAKGVGLHQVEPVIVAAYIKEFGGTHSRPTVKQHLAAIRMLFDWFVTGHVMKSNPAGSVRGPKHVVKQGTTPVLTADEARKLLDSIETERENKDGTKSPVMAGLRDRALIGLMVYSFARVSAALTMRVEDYYTQGRRGRFRLHEKGGKLHQVPAHHNAEAYLDDYVEAAKIADDRKGPLFRTIDRTRTLTASPMSRYDALKMIKRRARAAGLPPDICNHTFRATGITAYLDNGGTIENAQAIAAHESPRTTKLYDRTSDAITLDEVERILI